MGVVFRVGLVVLLVASVVVNMATCFVWCSGKQSLFTPYPYLTDDHTLHYANALATRRFLADSWTNAGYDPFFMAGLSHKVVFPRDRHLGSAPFSLLDPPSPACN